MSEARAVESLASVLGAIRAEVVRAERKHAPMNSAHEGYAVILEEVRELEAEVFKGGRVPRDWQAMHAEAIETAAMCVRLIRDVIEPKLVEQLAHHNRAHRPPG